MPRVNKQKVEQPQRTLPPIKAAPTKALPPPKAVSAKSTPVKAVVTKAVTKAAPAKATPARQVQRRFTQDELKHMVEQAYYAAAQDTSSMDFSFARNVGINEMLLSDLEKIRTRCRYELRNNGLAKGHAKMYANSVVGRGPRLKILGPEETEDWRTKVEKLFSQWSDNCDLLGGSLGQMIHFGLRQCFASGEYFKVSRVIEDPTSMLKIRWNFIRPDRLVNPQNMSGKNIKQGIEVNDDGQPLAYYISRRDPDISTDLADAIDRVE